MIDANKRQFGVILKRVADVFKTDLSSGLVDSYFAALKHLDFAAVERAVNRAIAECAFMPKPVELREMAGVAVRYVPPREIDGEPVYRCPTCRDIGIVIRQTSRGTMAAPCDCKRGEAERSAWEKQSEDGTAFADSARANSIFLRRIGEA